jgi:hypothetical protein
MQGDKENAREDAERRQNTRKVEAERRQNTRIEGGGREESGER